MKTKKMILIVISISLIVFSAFTIGFFVSGYTIFTGKYDLNALSAFSTLLNAIFAPVVSLVAALLFYSSLVSQKKSLKLQKEELSEIVNTNDFNIQNLNYSMVLNEIKDFNKNSFFNVENHYSSTTGKELREIELINELKLHLNNPRKALKQSAIILAENTYIDKPFISAEIGDKIVHKGHKCEVVIRKEDEVARLELIEKRFWILFGTMYSLINQSKNHDVYIKIFVSLLPYEYLEYSLGLFGKRGGYPDSNIITEMLEFYRYEIRKMS